MKRLQLLLLAFTFSNTFFQLLGQSVDCSPTPTNLPVNSTCITQSFSNNDNGTSQTVNSSCATGTAYEDVWYAVTGTGNTMTITLSGSNTASALAAFSGCGTGQLACADIASGATGSIVFPSTLGTTYYIQIQRRSGTSSTNQSGDICAVSPPPATGGDEPCTATPITVGASCSFGNYSNAGATASVGPPAPGCASYAGGDVWFTVTVPAAGNLTFDSNSGVITDGGMAIYSGTCGSLSLVSCDDDGSANGLMSMITLTGQTPGATLWIRFWEYGGDNNGSFQLCVYEPFVPPAPANDNCNNATPVPVNPTNLCTSVVPGTINGATASSQSNGCGGTADDDVWYSFVATSTSHLISLNNISGSTTDLYHSVYAGSCGSPGAALVCSDPESSVVSGLTPGNTYFVRVYSWTSLFGQTSTFNVRIGTPPPPPANDNCSGAIPVTVSSTSCAYTAGTIFSATASSQANGCGGTADDDVWYSFVATSPSVNITITNISGGTTDLYHSVYAGSCGSPGAALVCSDPNTSAVLGLTVGNTYFVRIFSWTSTAGQTSAFDLCILASGACGTPNNQDYCVAPAILTPGTSFSSNTSGTYTPDIPANLGSVFCGSIENNSWYQFVATSTTHSFPITSVSGCTFGIQAQVYAVTENTSGCCTNFASVSNCYNPANLSLGTVTATGLTIGNTYVLMVDGNGGSICDFTISGWNGTGILPVELIAFTGAGMEEYNALKWSTASETENDHFSVLRSFNGIEFEKIGELKGAGTTLHTTHYDFNDSEIRSGVCYYQLDQVDMNGKSTKSEVIAIDRSKMQQNEMNVFPNPTNNVVYIELQNEQIGGQLQLIDTRGEIIQEIRLGEESGKQIRMDLSEVNSGMYLIRLAQENGTVIVKKIARK